MDSFGTALGQILRDRDISARELANRLGLRSKTTLHRILQDRSGYAAVQKFWNHLLASGQLNITPQERSRMEDLLEILRVGPELYQTHDALHSLLHAQPAEGEPIAIEGIPGASTLDALTARYASAKQLELTITGLCDQRIYRALQRMCAAMPAHQQPKIRHYIFHIASATEAILNISAILPVLFQRGYEAYMAQPSQRFASAHFPGEMLLCRMVDEQDVVHYQQLAFAERDVMYGADYPDPTAYEYWQKLTNARGEALSPIKADFDGAHSAADYLPYIEYIRHLELNSNIYMLKPDIPLCLVPAPILYSAIADGPLGGHTDLLQQLYESHEKRYQHLFHRRKVMHCIFSSQSMLAFAKTGRTSDHFFGARAFTPQERTEILRHCLQQSQSNPYFSIHFSRSEALVQSAEITCYEGKGTILLNAHTAYRLDADHTEALITHDGFNRQLRTYYTSELLRSHVLSDVESCAFLRQLIGIAQTAG